MDRAVPYQSVFPCVPRSIGHRSRIRGVWEMRGAWRLVAGASDVPTVWLRRLLRQVKEQARPRAFPPNWPSLDPALQRAGYGLGVVLCGRGPARPDMTEVFCRGLLRIATNCARRTFRRRVSTIHGASTGWTYTSRTGAARRAHGGAGWSPKTQNRRSAETTLSNQLAGHRWMPRSGHCAGCGQAWCSSGNTFLSGRGRTTTSIGSMRPRIATVRRSS
jgi:hypothetical protein